MNHFLAQIILARRNEDLDGWMNVLFIVVLAIFWALGGILKARGKNAQDQKKEQLARKPARGLATRRPPAQGRGLLEQLLMEPQQPPSRAESRPSRPGVQQEARTRLAEIRAAARRFAAEAEEAFRIQTAEPVAEPPPMSPKPAIKHPTVVIPAFAAKPAIAHQEQPAPGMAETASEEYLAEILSDYDDPDLTRRAILHYEILGKPLSLRDPQEPATGF